MKKVIFIVYLLLCVSFNALGQIKTCAYFDGYWSEWRPESSVVKIKGNYDGFILYLEKEGPWNYRFKFTIDNMFFPNKKQRKKDIKEGNFYEFTGTVEYYITDDYPTILELFRKNKGALFAPAKLENGRPTKKVTSRATIKVAAFKDLPKDYNIWFDRVAFGISLGTLYFPNVKFK